MGTHLKKKKGVYFVIACKVLSRRTKKALGKLNLLHWRNQIRENQVRTLTLCAHRHKQRSLAHKMRESQPRSASTVESAKNLGKETGQTPKNN